MTRNLFLLVAFLATAPIGAAGQDLHAPVQGRRYFVDVVAGSDDNDGRSESSSWKSVERIHRALAEGGIGPGDGVYFRAGQTFPGPLRITRSGTPGRPVTFSAFGKGAKPVLSGLIPVEGWTPLRNGVWEADGARTAVGLNLVMLDAAVQPMGRTPNEGYLRVEGVDGASQITGSDPTPADWTGAEVVIRKVRWILDRNPIREVTGRTIRYESPSTYKAVAGVGYFLQNHDATLDRAGEWRFDRGRRKLRMHFGAGGPAGRTVRASALDAVVIATGQAHIVLDGLGIEGGNEAGVRVDNTQDVKILNSAIAFSGADGVTGLGVREFHLENTCISHSLNDGVMLSNSSRARIAGNVIADTGTMPGMGRSGDMSYMGLVLAGVGSENLIERNTLRNTGYSGINVFRGSVVVRNNVIDTFCTIKDDGGGIYTWTGPYPSDEAPKTISGNIVLHGRGAPAGTTDPDLLSAEGIYLDDGSSNIEVVGNTVAHCGRSGIYIHNSKDIVVRSNTLFDNRAQLNLVHDVTTLDCPIRGLTIRDNVMVARLATQTAVDVRSEKEDFSRMSTPALWDGNLYARLSGDPFLIRRIDAATAYHGYDLRRWQTEYGFDRNSRAEPPRRTSPPVPVGKNLWPDPAFDAGLGTMHFWSASGTGRAQWDNSGRLDGGCARVVDASSGPAKPGYVFSPVGPLPGRRLHQVRFSALGSNERVLGIFIRSQREPYPRLTPVGHFRVSPTRSEHEFSFTLAADEPQAAIAIQVTAGDTPFWVDNLQLREAASKTPAVDPARIEINPTGLPRSVALDGRHRPLTAGPFPNSELLNPYSSLILVPK